MITKQSPMKGGEVMKGLTLVVALSFVLVACVTGPSQTWEHAALGETELKPDIQQCKKLAKREVPEIYLPIPSRFAYQKAGQVSKAHQKRNEAFENCMLENGWERVEVKNSS
jgi:hypothetical protein